MSNPVTQKRWNLLVICLDTFRYDLLVHKAPWQVSLPNLDRFRSQSVEYTAAFGEGEPTIPVRRAYFTGERSFPWRYQFDSKGMWPTGRGWHKIPPQQPTLAEILLQSGYQTGLIADTYHLFKPTGNFTRGFLSWDFIRGYESDNFRGGHLPASALAPYVRDPEPAQHPILTQYLLNMRGREREEDWLTARTFLRAKAWLDDIEGSEPFFLWVDSFGPHEPWDPPPKYLAAYISDPQFPGPSFIYPVGMTRQDMSESEAQRVRELYLGYLTFVDHWVGVLLDTLNERRLSENTIVMVVNDHGTELMDHGQFSKHPSRLYTHNTQLIWLIRHPGHAPTSCNAFVQSHDLFPTALSLLGIDYEPVAGQNTWPWVDGIQDGRRDYVITGWGSYASVRTSQWNYFVNFENPREENEYLFSLNNDSGEHHNVVKEYPAIVSDLRSRLEDFLGQKLPARLTDRVEPSEAPIRTYLGSRTSQTKKDAGFV